MKRILLVLFTVLSFNLFAFAGFDAPLKIDEFSIIQMEDLMARLDYFAQTIRKSPRSVGLIVVNKGKESRPGFPYRYSARMKTYLTRNNIVPENQLITKECSDSNQLVTSLYLLPNNIDFKSLSGWCENELPTFSETTLFDSYHYYFRNPDFEDCCEIKGADLAEADASLKVFADVLRKTPDSKAYVFIYGGTNVYGVNNKTVRKLDSQKLVQKTLQETKEKLIRNGIEESRIVAVNGGYKDSARNTELWFVTANGSIPKLRPNYFFKKKQITRKR